MARLKSVLVVLIGDELLNGSIQDKNAKFLLTNLSCLPNLRTEVLIIPDVREIIVRHLKSGIENFDLVVTSGGLGPTTDDLTIESIAEALDVNLVQDQASLDRLLEKYKKRGRPVTENSYKQTFFPEGSLILENQVGTADSCISKTKFNSAIACFPGVPSEFEFFINGSFWRWLKSEYELETTLSTIQFRVFGISEAYIGSQIEKLKIDKRVSVAYRPQFPEVLVSLKSSTLSKADLLKINDQVIDSIGPEFIHLSGDDLENDKLPKTVLELLKSKSFTLSVAESCTGGRIASELTKIPGSSASFLGGVVCYSNDLKINFLNVDKNIIETKGAVSEEVAYSLANSILKKTKSSYAISVTGIAGPSGDTKEKEIGLVYIGIANSNTTKVFKHNLPWDRVRNQTYITWLALDLVRRSILNYELTWDTK